ncbi:GIY-YIG nuclease family protein [Acutalibacter muris]|uniref:GIY-YIG nuclease family protein n=1 Tax=Acutalibacter muris TaxID=1796620 RepID=UPI001C3EEDD6|nr:GIY-YIG nuclease family protein [Acutalibacter muris]
MVKTITKWAFGMAPYKKETYKQILFSIDILEESLNNKSVDFNRMLESISRIKGLYNRIIRQDQWDWMTTAAYFDFPTTYECRHIVSFLSHLKSGINSSDEHLILQAKDRLCKSTVRCHFQNFRTYNPAVGRNGQYIYILSRREDRDVLKIGMTTRDVVVRAREINSATGVLYPLGVRKVFKVHDAHSAEKAIHKALAEYRIRDDREFFKIGFQDACGKIEKLIADFDL